MSRISPPPFKVALTPCSTCPDHFPTETKPDGDNYKICKNCREKRIQGVIRARQVADENERKSGFRSCTKCNKRINPIEINPRTNQAYNECFNCRETRNKQKTEQARKEELRRKAEKEEQEELKSLQAINNPFLLPKTKSRRKTRDPILSFFMAGFKKTNNPHITGQSVFKRFDCVLRAMRNKPLDMTYESFCDKVKGYGFDMVGNKWCMKFR